MVAAACYLMHGKGTPSCGSNITSFMAHVGCMMAVKKQLKDCCAGLKFEQKQCCSQWTASVKRHRNELFNPKCHEIINHKHEPLNHLTIKVCEMHSIKTQKVPDIKARHRRVALDWSGGPIQAGPESGLLSQALARRQCSCAAAQTCHQTTWPDLAAVRVSISTAEVCTCAAQH